MKAVFLHGLGQTAKAWEAVLAQCPECEADCPELFLLSPSKHTYSAVLAALEDRYAAEKEPFLLCGLSLGAMLALDYAAWHPDQAAALVLIGAQDRAPKFLLSLQNFLFHCMPQRAFAKMGLPKQAVLELTRSMCMLDLRSAASRVKCPVVLLCGEKDKPNRKAAERLHRRMPQSNLKIVPGAGHEVNIEAPEAAAAVVRELLL